MPSSAVPPTARSRTALGLLRGVAAGTLVLQRCAECATVQYPPRDACRSCLGADLPWTEVSNGGRVLASTLVRTSNEEYFAERTPWPVGLIQADCGPRIVSHLLAGLTAGDRVRIEPAADPAGRPVLVSRSANAATLAVDPDQLAGFNNRVQDRAVLVTDSASALGVAVVDALRTRAASVIVSADSSERGSVDLLLDTRG